ncbi:hypothetical protein X798_07585, partial [Onchocerca flexuosa]
MNKQMLWSGERRNGEREGLRSDPLENDQEWISAHYIGCDTAKCCIHADMHLKSVENNKQKCQKLERARITVKKKNEEVSFSYFLNKAS